MPGTGYLKGEFHETFIHFNNFHFNGIFNRV